MTAKVLYCFDTDNIEKVLENFGKLQIHRMPVMDKNKRFVGEITLGDIARAAKGDTKLDSLIGKAKELISNAA